LIFKKILVEFQLTELYLIKAKDADIFISGRSINRNILKFNWYWGIVYNPNFNYGEYAIIKGQVLSKSEK
jgi:hypothetical protein